MKKEYEKPVLTVGFFTDVLTASGDLFDEKIDNGVGAIGKWWED